MARGSSRASSEVPDDFKKAIAKGAAGQGPRISEEEGYQKELVEHFKDMRKAGMQDELKGVKAKELNEAAKYVAEASSDVRDQRDDFDRTVEQAKKALDAGIIDFASYSQASEVLPLTFSEIQDGADPFDIIKDAVEEERPDDIEEFVRDFIQERVDSASANRDDYDDEVNTIEQDALEHWLNEREKGGEV